MCNKNGGNVIFHHQKSRGEPRIRQPLKVSASTPEKWPSKEKRPVFQLPPGYPTWISFQIQGNPLTILYFLRLYSSLTKFFAPMRVSGAHPQQSPFDHCRAFLFRDDTRFDALQNVGHCVLKLPVGWYPAGRYIDMILFCGHCSSTVGA